MKKTHISLIFAAVVCLLAAYAVTKYKQTGSVFDKDIAGKTAPDFSLNAISGDKLKLTDYKGKLVVLNFWASWCPPCRAEIPGFIKIQKKYNNKPFTFIGVALEGKEDVLQYIKEVGINYPVTYGVEEAYEVASAYGNPDGALPYTLLIDSEQKILEVFSGFLSETKLEELILKNL